ncbi:MAG: hypothetical protein BGP06_17805 [Rhizobiales bacterium 65-9]|nr:3'(2'),5'-bisphosphate nucleotidase CysQ [Hyphomicrobiales bacterium]OJY34702.1 MAG: hypothetical protein BGP06_17805 [Rhizobiales bacterium 65-9]
MIELEALAAIVARAGRALAAAPRRQGLTLKADGSPVTAADLACERALALALAEAWPALTIIAEESAPADGLIPAHDVAALIDPLDGTKAFAEGRDDFCICLAIIERGTPRLGVIGAPARGVVYAAAADQGLAWRSAVAEDGSLTGERAPLVVRRCGDHPAGLVSDRHGDADSEALLRRLGTRERIALSSALKFAMIAEGKADIYPRLASTMAWDTAAGQTLLSAAGGVTLDRGGAPLRYPAGSPLANPGFVAMGDPALARAAFGEGR